MNITQREMVLGVVTFGAVLTGLSWWIIDGKMDAHKAKKTEIQQIRQQIRLDERRIQMQNDWIVELNNLQKDLRVFGTNQKSVAPDLMQTVMAIANKHGLDITRNQPYEEKPTAELVELGINCTWEGKLEALVGFLAELQQQGVRYDVTTLNVKPVGKNTGRLQGNMVINCAFVRKEKPIPAQTAAPDAGKVRK